MPDKPRYYDDFTGCGNALNLDPSARPADGDGFAALLGRGATSTASASTSPPRWAAGRTASIAAPRFSPRSARTRCWPRVKLIAEPWDIGLGGYQVGGFPPGWSEWNDNIRDACAATGRAKAASSASSAGRMTASADLFNHDGRSPRASINHVTVHDGFTLADLVSYEHKHNEANGEDNRDGIGRQPQHQLRRRGADRRSQTSSTCAQRHAPQLPGDA